MAGTSRTAPEDRGGSMGRDGRPDPATEAFLAHRNLLFTVAYEMLGSAADAEDVLQETWLRWAGVDLDTVRDQRAYLVRITTRQALSRLRTLGRRKESYVGPWLPEPLLDRARRGRGRRAGRQRLDGDAAGAGDPQRRPSGRCSCCARCSTWATTRSPKPSARARPRSARSRTGHGHTSRRAGRAGWFPRPRPETRSRRSSGRPKPAICSTCSTSSRRTSSSWATAAESCRPCRRPIVGAGRVARVLAAGLRRIAATASLQPAQVNGYPALILRLDGEIDTVIAVRIDDGLITGLYAVRNPEKLSHMEQETTLRR